MGASWMMEVRREDVVAYEELEERIIERMLDVSRVVGGVEEGMVWKRSG